MKPTARPSTDSRAEIRRLRETDPPVKWRHIAASFRPVPAGTLARYAYDPTYEPRRLDYRRALGLPDLPPVTVRAHPCGHCGQVHIRKTCPNSKRESAGRPQRVRYSARAVSTLLSAYTAAVVGVMFGAAHVD